MTTDTECRLQAEAKVIQRYSDPAFVATNLEAEWSDYFFATHPHQHPERNELDPTAVISPHCYLTAKNLLVAEIAKQNGVLKNFCDVGGATGRVLYETMKRFNTIEKAFLIEPVTTTCQWAKTILTQPENIISIPCIAFSNELIEYRPDRLPELLSNVVNVEFINTRLEDSGVLNRQFDAVTCLNVADRHPAPDELVNDLAKIVRPNGILLFSSPMDWNSDFTPRDRWVSDLKQLFNRKQWQVERECDIAYDFRYSHRRYSRFLSQTLCLIRQFDS